jgi:glycine hydroxymethyltransferase
LSGKYFNIINYHLNKKEHLDYTEIEKIAIKEKPKLIICGYTNYSKKFSFKKFSNIAKKSNSFLLADISHIAGLIVSGYHQSPIGYADFITSTTHKTLRGIRSAFILVKKQYIKQLDVGVFPGVFGGPKNNEIFAKAICFKEANKKEFKNYIKRVLYNTNYLCESLKRKGFKIVSGGTNIHLFSIDLRNKNINGRTAAILLEKNGIICNANSIPNENGTPFNPSGIRLGLAFETTKNITIHEIENIAKTIHKVINRNIYKP